jgi:hypothetical protein
LDPFRTLSELVLQICWIPSLLWGKLKSAVIVVMGLPVFTGVDSSVRGPGVLPDWFSAYERAFGSHMGQVLQTSDHFLFGEEPVVLRIFDG